MYPLEYNPVLSEAGHCQSRYAGLFPGITWSEYASCIGLCKMLLL